MGLYRLANLALDTPNGMVRYYGGSFRGFYCVMGIDIQPSISNREYEILSLMGCFFKETAEWFKI